MQMVTEDDLEMSPPIRNDRNSWAARDIPDAKRVSHFPVLAAGRARARRK